MANWSMLPACRATTLNLPVEFLFDDKVAPPKYFWEKLPNDMEFWPSKFTNYERYIGLLRISEQTYKEVKSLFPSTYASRVTFYFSNAVELVEFVDRDYNPDHAVLGNAQFLLYTHRNPYEAADMQPIVQPAEYLCQQQPGFNRDWEWIAGYYREDIDIKPGHDKELHCVVFQGRFRDLRLGQFHRPDRAEDLAHARSAKCAQVFCNLCNKRFDGLDEDGVPNDDDEEDEEDEEDEDEGEDDIVESEVFDEGSDDGDEAEESGGDGKSAEE
ncbi:hypothetical protein LTR42_004492 [Elasticomyces elasticus]|nr:hypothetical protein LTR42_004492 [Elasticomyces elasticus]